MADYWKSQPRKYCDFCKCWIADNKPSRDFHERGKRHQQAVKDKLTDLKKKGVRDAKKEIENNVYMQEMEKEALKKFKQDLEDNPELAKQYAGNRELLTAQQKDKIELEKKLKGIVKQKQDDQDPGDWQEAYTEEGYTYYWNDKTGVSSWYPPGMPDGEKKDGGEEGEGSEKKAKMDANDIQLQTPLTEMQEKRNLEKNEKENKINKKNNDKTPDLKDTDSKNVTSSKGIKTIRNSTGFGSWTTVVKSTDPQPFIDLQLPKVKSKPVQPSKEAFEPFDITERTIPTTPVKKTMVKLEIGKLGFKKVEGGGKDVVKSEDKEDVKIEVRVRKRKMNLRRKEDED